MFDRSKLLKVFKICITIILALAFVLIVVLFNRCSKSIENTVIEETTKEVHEKFVFDLKIAPYKQKKKIKDHLTEYEDQIYNYLFKDEKLVNTAKQSGHIDYYHLVENYGDFEDVCYILSDRPIRNLINMVFSNEDIDYDKYAFTDNYIKNHPKQLRIEFAKYYNDGYEIKREYNDELKTNITCTAFYSYEIGIDKNNQMVELTESKSIDFDSEDGEHHGTRHGKIGSAWEGEELCEKTRIIYFKYMLDDKGYLDDIKFDHQQILMEDKLLDEMCP